MYCASWRFFASLALLGVLSLRAQGQTFGSHGYSTYQTAAVPEDLVVVDLNGDGALDIAVGDTSASDTGNPDVVSVFINKGNGEFFPRVDYTVGDRPEGICAGTFDANSSLDLATANFNAGTVSILLNGGGGTFTPGATIAVSGGPRSVTSGDFDGDSKTDLVTSNYDGNSVSFLKGGGDGTFTLIGSTSVGRSPEVVAKGRIDGDSVLDLVTCDVLDDTVTVLHGNGDGTFTLLATVPVGDRPRHVKCIDLNGDSLDDILVANNGVSTVSVLRNVGGTSFTTAGTLSITGMTGDVYVNAGDLNVDGFIDVVVTFANSDKIGVFPGTGAFTFGPGEKISTGDNPVGIGVGDLDASGRLDLVVTNALEDSLFVYLSTLNITSYPLDNGQPGTSSTGTWSISTAPDPFGANSLFAKATAGTSFTWTVSLPAAGTYSVYAWWTMTTSRVTAAPYTVTHNAGQTTVMKDQTKNGGQWNSLGTYSFGTTGTVRVDATSSSLSTCADAVCFLPITQANQPPSAQILAISPSPSTFGDSVTFTGTGNDPDGSVSGYQWRSSLDGVLSSASSFSTTTLQVGTHDIFFKVQDNQGLWSPEVHQTQVVNPVGPIHTVVMDNGDPGTSFTGTWAVSGGPNPYGVSSIYAKNGPTYSYNFTLQSPGEYQVYAWWTSISTRPSSAPIDITSLAGTSTVLVDQRVNGGQWNLLGTFIFSTSAVVKINAVGSSSTCADAICLSLVGPPDAVPTAQIDSITPSPATQGDQVTFTGHGNDSDGSITAYEWRSSIDGPLSTLASFSSSTLSPGTHTIFFRVRDDRQIWSSEAQAPLLVNSPGGQHTFILDNGQPGTSFTGTWTVSGGPNPFGANSLYAKNGPTYTYTFTSIPEGTYQVFAWWTAVSTRPTSAPYEITHSAGTSTVNVDQTVNGGQWNLLGAFTFGTTATVKITAVGSASTCADAICIQSSSSTPSDVIVDNGASGTSFTGTWTVSGGPNPYGANSLYAKNGATYTYAASLNGTYRVHAWWTSISTRPTSAPYAITHSSGTATVNVDQTVNGGQWNLLGTFTFSGTGSVKITAVGTASTCADAVRFEPVP